MVVVLQLGNRRLSRTVSRWSAVRLLLVSDDQMPSGQVDGGFICVFFIMLGMAFRKAQYLLSPLRAAEKMCSVGRVVAWRGVVAEEPLVPFICRNVTAVDRAMVRVRLRLTW